MSRSPWRESPAVGMAIVDNEPVHRIEGIRGKLGHLLGGGGKFSRTRSGLLDELPHFLHGANNALCARRLFLNGRSNFLGDFREAVRGLGDLRRATRLLSGSRSNF